MLESVFESPAAGRREILRSKFPEEIECTAKLLSEDGIAFRVSANKASFEYSDLGHGGVPPDVILSVAEGDYRVAREKLEAAYGNESLPEGHFLNHASNEDIAAILAEADEWSPFDVAQARNLQNERSIPPRPEQELEAKLAVDHSTAISAPRWLVPLGWLLSLLGTLGGFAGIQGFLGLLALWIGWTVGYGTRNVSDVWYPRFDPPSRREGRWLYGVTLVLYLIWAMASRYPGRG